MTSRARIEQIAAERGLIFKWAPGWGLTLLMHTNADRWIPARSRLQVWLEEVGLYASREFDFLTLRGYSGDTVVCFRFMEVPSDATIMRLILEAPTIGWEVLL